LDYILSNFLVTAKTPLIYGAKSLNINKAYLQIDLRASLRDWGSFPLLCVARHYELKDCKEAVLTYAPEANVNDYVITHASHEQRRHARGGRFGS